MNVDLVQQAAELGLSETGVKSELWLQLDIKTMIRRGH